MPPLLTRDGAAPVQVVVGDRFGASCHGSVAAECFAGLAARGREAAHNRPYAGGYVLERHADPARGVHALQLEIDRGCYLDAALVEPGEGLAAMARDLSMLVRRLAALVCDLGEDGQGGDGLGGAWPLAAE
jgi:N-formylglutamate amidohydrolase